MDRVLHKKERGQRAACQRDCPFCDYEGNLLKGIVIWFNGREGIEPIKRVSSLFLFLVTSFL
jgi:hypothetical protein